MAAIHILRAGPLTSLQDEGRPGMLRHGISASGPMDRAAFERAGDWLGGAGTTGMEFTRAGLAFTVEGASLSCGFDGGEFTIHVDGEPRSWPTRAMVPAGGKVEITPGPSGNYGYVRFDREIEVPLVMGSRSTNSIAALGGYFGRSLAAGDRLELGSSMPRRPSPHPSAQVVDDGPIRFTWGIHADLFPAQVRQRFIEEAFTVTEQIDRMGVRLADPGGVFAKNPMLSLVSDAVVAGDVQILGNGTPIVLMRDHQPTGGYPRIATIASVDLDRFAQLRPGATVRFAPITVATAQGLMK